MAAGAAAAVLYGCVSEAAPEPVISVMGEQSNSGAMVYMSAPAIGFDAVTRSVGNETSGGLQFRWDDGDIVGVYSGKGSMSTFRLTGGEGTSRGVFDGGGFDLRRGEGYHALYPYDGLAADINDIELSYEGQILSTDLDKSHVGRHDFMSSYAVVDESGNAEFSFRHLGSFVRMSIESGCDADLESLELIPYSGTIVTDVSYDLGNGSFGSTSSKASLKAELTDSRISEGGDVSLWMALPSQDLSGRGLSAVFRSVDGRILSSRLEGRNLQVSRAYSLDGSLVPLDYDSYVEDLDIEDLGQSSLDEIAVDAAVQSCISSSDLYQFSAISPIGNEDGMYHFAIVSDKGRGGGIFTLDLSIDSEGSIGEARIGSLPGTAAATDVRDPEGLVRTQAGYLVSGEDQRIVEYDLEGYPTGREAAIPGDMSQDNVTFNMGFEALAFDGDNTVFTVTEGPLPSDEGFCPVEDLGQLLRIQSFNADDLSASSRYPYLMDKPVYANVPDDAMHVHGVSAMTALPDGRLAVLEREVYTNLATVTAISRVKIYLVDPVNDRGGILSKSLLHEFSTGIDLMNWGLNLANYEGMCTITLPDGSPALVMVCDAQGHLGYSWGRINSRLKDYIRIIRL